MSQIIKFRAFLKKPKIMLDDVAVYPEGLIGINVSKIIPILDTKYQGQVYYDEERGSITFGPNDEDIEVLPCEEGWVNIPAEEVEIMQFTGQNDTNGNEIYKWDILSGKDKYGKTANVVVTWFNANAEYILVDTNEYPNDDEPNYISVDQPWSQREIIGNTFENPELLK